jgi:hypothetical protein
MKKLLSRTHSSETTPSQVVFTPAKTSSSMKTLKSPKIENGDDNNNNNNNKIANGHGGNKATKNGEGGEKKQKFVRLRNWITGKQITDTLHQQKSDVRVCSYMSS